MKWIFLLLFPSLAFADVVTPAMSDLLVGATIQRSGDNVTVRYTNADQTSCWWVNAKNYTKIPETETPVLTVILSNLSDSRPCGAWYVAKNGTRTDRPLYQPDPWKNVGRVKIGVICENVTLQKSTSGREWRWTTNAQGLRGWAVCGQ